MSAQAQAQYPVFIPPLAWSRRTSGFMFYVIDKQGCILYKGKTSKRSIYIELPAEPYLLVRFYESYKGHRYIDLYEFKRSTTGVYKPQFVKEISDMEDFVDKVAKLPVSEDLKEVFIAWLSW